MDSEPKGKKASYEIKVDSLDTRTFNEIDFIEMLRLYQRLGNQEKVDAIAFFYIVRGLSKRKDMEEYPSFKGITLSEDLIRKFSAKNLTFLLKSGVEPKPIIVDCLLKLPDSFVFETYDELYARGLITIKDLEKVLLEASDEWKGKNFPQSLENILAILSKDLTKYEGIDKYRIIDKFLKFLSIETIDKLNVEQLYVVLNAILNLLKNVDYSYKKILVEIIKTIVSILEKSNFKEKQRVFDVIENFTKDVLKDRSTPDILRFVGSSYRQLFTIEPAYKVLKSSVDEDDIFNLICTGEIRRVALALNLFPKLRERKSEIINTWVKNGFTAPIDIYLKAFLDSDNLTQEEDNLDYNYSHVRSQPKNLTMKPVRK